MVSINIGNGWSQNTNSFIAPYDGVYYFSYSFGVPTSQELSSSLNVTSLIGTRTVCRADVTHNNGLDLASRGCLLFLAQGDVVQWQQFNGSMDSSYEEVSFRGFYYSPAQGGKSFVAWSAHSDVSLMDITGDLHFTQIFVNLGQAWSFADNVTVNIPVKGTYYIEMVGHTYIGIIDMRLMLNGSSVVSRLLFLYRNALYVTRSRSILVNLNLGDKLTVQCNACYVNGNAESAVSFQGLLLFSN